MAVGAYSKDNFDKAIGYFEQALAIHREIGNRRRKNPSSFIFRTYPKTQQSHPPRRVPHGFWDRLLIALWNINLMAALTLGYATQR